MQKDWKRNRQKEMSPPALGVDIGDHSVKIVTLEETADGLALRAAARAPLPDGAVSDGVVDPLLLAPVLRRLLREMPFFRSRLGLLAAPTAQALVRWIDLPALAPDETLAAARFEARKYLTYPIEDAEAAVIDVEPVGLAAESRQRVLLAAVPRQIVASRAAALELAGCEVGGMELEPFALLRAQMSSSRPQCGLWRGQPLTYVQLGEESSAICVAREASVRFLRTILWGSGRLTSALADALALSLPAARALKERPDVRLGEDGIFRWTDGGVPHSSDALLPELDRLRREIQRLLNYYRSLFPERSYEGILDRVVLCGGTADLPGVRAWFARALQLEVMHRNPFRPIAIWPSPELAAALAGQESSYAVAVGLALGQIESARAARQERERRSHGYVWRRKAA